MIIVMAVSLYTSRIVLSTLGASDFGIYNVVGGVVTIMVFLNSALGASTSRFLTYELGHGDFASLKNTFSATLNLHLFIALVVLIFGETLGLWFLNNKLVIPEDRMYAAFWVYQFSIITTMINFTQIPYSATLISHENMSVYAYVGLYEGFSNLFIVLLLRISPIDKLIFYGLLLMLNRLAIQFFYRFYSKKRYAECRFCLVWDKRLYKKLLSYSGWDLFGGLSAVSQNQGVNIIINIFFGPVVNASRAIASQVQSAVSVFASNFLIASRPQVIKRFARDDIQGMYNLTFKAAKYAYCLMLAFVAPICLEIEFVLRLWLGNSVPEYTSTFTLIVLLTCLLGTFHTASLMPYHAIGRIKIGNLFGGSIMVAALPISYFLFKIGYPPESALITIFFTNLGQQFLTWIIIHKYQKFCYKVLIKKVYLPCLIISLISITPSIFICYFMQVSLVRFFINLTLFETLLLLALWVIGLDYPEKELVKSYIRKIIHK